MPKKHVEDSHHLATYQAANSKELNKREAIQQTMLESASLHIASKDPVHCKSILCLRQNTFVVLAVV